MFRPGKPYLGCEASGVAVGSGAVTGTVSGDGDELSEDELADVVTEVLSLLDVEHDALVLEASVALSDDEVLVQSVLDDVAVAGSVVVDGVVCAMVSMGVIPRAATKTPAAAMRTKDFMIISLSVLGRI